MAVGSLKRRPARVYACVAGGNRAVVLAEAPGYQPRPVNEPRAQPSLFHLFRRAIFSFLFFFFFFNLRYTRVSKRVRGPVPYVNHLRWQLIADRNE